MSTNNYRSYYVLSYVFHIRQEVYLSYTNHTSLVKALPYSMVIHTFITKPIVTYETFIHTSFGIFIERLLIVFTLGTGVYCLTRHYQSGLQTLGFFNSFSMSTVHSAHTSNSSLLVVSLSCPQMLQIILDSLGHESNY